MSVLIGMPRASAPLSSHGAFKGMPKVYIGSTTKVRITYRVDMEKVLSDRNMAKHLHSANKWMMMYWHAEMRPKHFTTKGFSEYHYQRRRPATYRIKKKKYGHGLPIKFTGTAESFSESIRSLRVTPRRATLTMPGPWYMGVRNKSGSGGLSPDLRDELTRVSRADAMRIAHLGGKMVRKSIALDKKRKLGAKKIKP